MSEQPQVIDLFCGAGGLALGFHEAGLRSTFAVDLDKDSVDTFNANLGDGGEHDDGRPSGPAIAAGIEAVHDLPDASIIVGGPPCQGFSLLGVQHRRVVELTTGAVLEDPRNQLWKHYLRVVRAIEPVAFVMENVPPLLKSDEFAAFEALAEQDGYQITKAVLLAADYGVPQRRRRAIVIGSRLGRPAMPFPTHARLEKDWAVDPQGFIEDVRFEIDEDSIPYVQTALSRANGERLRPWRTVRDAFIEDGERPLPLEPDEVNWHIGRNPMAMSLERYRCVPPGGNRFDLPDHLTPNCWKNKPTGSTDLFGRLEWDKPSLTIRTEFFKPEKGRYLHPQAHRPITHREAMRLQTFDDSLKWCGSKISVARQVGNAVPVALAHHVALAVKEHLVQAGHLGEGPSTRDGVAA